jgi:HAD superfamily hydrolase (TIGR01509 family)
MLKNVIFDCSDTLLKLKSPAWLAYFDGDLARAERIHNGIFASRVWFCYDNGTATLEDVEREAIPLLPPQDRALARRYVRDWITGVTYAPIDGMPQLLADLKAAGLRLYLLSDFPPCFSNLAARFDFFSLFDGMTVSYRAGCSKRDNGALFDHLLQEYALDPQECAFVDDLPAYLTLAEARGIRAHLAGDAALLRTWLKAQGCAL